MAVAAALLADRLLGEPPDRVHPVALFGRAMGHVEERVYAGTPRAGVAYAVAGVALGSLAGVAARSPVAATYLSVAGRGLADAAIAVEQALDAGDLEEARRRLPSLVGRDPSELDEGEIARAAVESVAENTVDAIVAPALWALALGSPGVLAHRAVNTMDAMVGHRDPRYQQFGWAAARLDDLAGWVPARTTAALVAACRPSMAGDVWRAVREDAPTHPSPNSGVAEAAFAAALGLQLGGVSRYGQRVEERPPLGCGRPPTVADISRTVRLSREVTLMMAGVAVAGSAIARARPRRRST